MFLKLGNTRQIKYFSGGPKLNNNEILRTELNKVIIEIFGKNEQDSSKFEVEIKEMKKNILIEIMPRIYKWDSVNEYDNVNTLFIMYDCDSGILTATSKSDFYKEFAVELKEKINKAFSFTKLKSTFL
jgi:hypothetical protein